MTNDELVKLKKLSWDFQEDDLAIIIMKIDKNGVPHVQPCGSLLQMGFLAHLFTGFVQDIISGRKKA